MSNYTKKILAKEIQNLRLPFHYTIKYFNEETDKISDEITNIVYVYLSITNDQCSKLKKPFNTSIYFNFNESYPLLPPMIYLEDTINHDLVKDDSILLCDYCPILKFGQLISNVYCIIIEGLENGQNDDLIDVINQ